MFLLIQIHLNFDAVMCRCLLGLKERYRVALNWESGHRREAWLLRRSFRYCSCWLSCRLVMTIQSVGMTIKSFMSNIVSDDMDYWFNHIAVSESHRK